VLQGHELGDHPAHRGADEVDAVQAEGVEQPHRVAGQVGECVGDTRGVAAQHRHDVGRAGVVEVRGEPDVAVVEADDVQPPLGQAAAEVVGPPDHLGGQAHDEQDRWIAGLAEGLVRDLDLADPGPLDAAVHGLGR
jgi:hypothetical protein